MKRKKNTHLIINLLAIGMLIAGLSYVLHPGLGQFSLTINGQPVADPLARLAAIPTLLLAMLFTGLLVLLAFLGVGMMLFLGALLFAVLGIFIIAPYLWPVLAIIFLVILLMSLGRDKQI
ncbi:hypothetical protein [Methylobacter luteus]|uniref:hypothetical protein n=1 Tax=Methylobacter luteus TaxID=415 RepID=UPI000423550E|nr:hypothetical protein [Methylobacter luteus]